MFSGRTLSLIFLVVISFQFVFTHQIRELSSQAPEAKSSATSLGYNTLDSLFQGNKKFRNVASRRRAALTELVEESPTFMFLGCTDNRLTPASIFQSPIGSIITQNNIGNQYSKQDTGTDAAITYAIQDLGVQHIIVLGHYGCKGISRAITGSKEKDSIWKWIEPIAKHYKRERRKEVVKLRDSRMPQRGLPNGATEPPDHSDPGLRAFVEENVRDTVKALREHSILAKDYQESAKLRGKKTKYEVYVHGFVFDEETGAVVNLKISFGPPGMPIPHVPFTATQPPENFPKKKDWPNFFKGKTLPKLPSDTGITEQ